MGVRTGQGIPFPKFFAHVSNRCGVPVHTIILAATLQVSLSLIFIGNTTAFNAFIALSTVGINLSYCLPVFLYLSYGRRRLKVEKRATQPRKISTLHQFCRCSLDVVFDSVPHLPRLPASYTSMAQMMYCDSNV